MYQMYRFRLRQACVSPHAWTSIYIRRYSNNRDTSAIYISDTHLSDTHRRYIADTSPMHYRIDDEVSVMYRRDVSLGDVIGDVSAMYRSLIQAIHRSRMVISPLRYTSEAIHLIHQF
jgi:hypothetical protein